MFIEKNENGGEETSDEPRPSILPKRLSELNVRERIKPVPQASSLFIFSHTNRYVHAFVCCNHHLM